MLDGVWAADETHLTSLREEVLRLSKLVDGLGMLSRYESDSLVLSSDRGFCMGKQFGEKRLTRIRLLMLDVAIKLVPVAAMFFRIIHCFVRFTNQLFNLHAIARVYGNSNACRNGD